MADRLHGWQWDDVLMVVALVRFKLYSVELHVSSSEYHVQLLAIAPCISNIVGKPNQFIQSTRTGHMIDYTSSGQDLWVWQTHLRLWHIGCYGGY